MNNLNTASENITDANSRIRDTDMAKTMMQYTQGNTLTQAAQAMLAQANQAPSSVLFSSNLCGIKKLPSGGFLLVAYKFYDFTAFTRRFSQKSQNPIDKSLLRVYNKLVNSKGAAYRGSVCSPVFILSA